jgi:hypothetical protein
VTLRIHTCIENVIIVVKCSHHQPIDGEDEPGKGKVKIMICYFRKTQRILFVAKIMPGSNFGDSLIVE